MINFVKNKDGKTLYYAGFKKPGPGPITWFRGHFSDEREAHKELFALAAIRHPELNLYAGPLPERKK